MFDIGPGDCSFADPNNDADTEEDACPGNPECPPGRGVFLSSACCDLVCPCIWLEDELALPRYLIPSSLGLKILRNLPIFPTFPSCPSHTFSDFSELPGLPLAP